MRKSAIEQIELEAFARGFRAAQQSAALRFGGLLSYEEGNKAMNADAARAEQAVADHIAEHGEYVGAQG